ETGELRVSTLLFPTPVLSGSGSTGFAIAISAPPVHIEPVGHPDKKQWPVYEAGARLANAITAFHWRAGWAAMDRLPRRRVRAAIVRLLFFYCGAARNRASWVPSAA